MRQPWASALLESTCGGSDDGADQGPLALALGGD